MSPAVTDTPNLRAAVIRRLRNAALLLGTCLTGSYVAVAAVVSMQQPDSGGGVIQIPVVLYGDGDEDLSGIQFDIHFDVSNYELVEVTGGAAALDAGKEVILSSPTPGAGRILITGFNNDSMFDGHVATVVLRPLVSDAASYTLSLDNLLASDPFGNSVDVAYEDLYAFPPAEPEKTEAPEDDVAESEPEENAAEDGPEAAESGVRDIDGTATSDTDTASAVSEGALVSGGGVRLDDREASSEAAPNPGPGTASGRRYPLYSPDSVARTGTASGTSGYSPPTAPIRPSTSTTPGSIRPPSNGPRPAPVRTVNEESREPDTGTDIGTPSQAPFKATRGEIQLSLAYPTIDAFARSGTGGAHDVPGGTTTFVSGLSSGYAALALLLGTLLFGALVSARAFLLDRGMRRRWRRLK